MSILKNGTILNRNQYRITKFIAQGGFGITYLAEEIGYYKQSGYGEEYVQSRNPEIVVIKELYYNDYCQRDEVTGLISISNVDKKQEFQKLVKNQMDEGKTIRGLQHPNIIRTRDIFHENDTAYMVMDYVESTDLEEMLKDQKFLGKEKAMKYINQLISAVDYIHTKIDKKILHLDISPSNILIDKSSDTAILIDFGSALSYDNVQNNITSTTSQIVTGRKKHYSPNEQGDIDNLKSFDATFDTYAIGATLYHLLSGEKPPLSSMVSTGREKITPPSEFRNDGEVSQYLDAVIMKSIAPFYRERYDSAEQLGTALSSEEEYAGQLQEIKKLMTENKFSEAKLLIRQTSEKFLKTPDLENFENQINQQLEFERKDREYNIFLKKGNNMLAAGELEMALDYYESAKEIFPDKTEIQDKIKYCKDQIDAKKREESAKLAAASSFQQEQTELLTPQNKIQEKAELENEATELLEKPKPLIQENTPKSEPVKTAPPIAEKTTVSNYPEKKSKSGKGLLIGGIAAALIGVGGIMYAMGIFGNKNPKTPENNLPTVSTTDSIQANSTADSVLAAQNLSNIITPAETGTSEPASEKADDNAWKNRFEASYTAIMSSESKLSPQDAIDKYKALLKTIPASGKAERERVNYRITSMILKRAELAKKDEKKKEKEPEIVKKSENKISDADMAQYNKDLQWAKNMINVDGCDGCRENDVCRNQVTAKLKNALAKNPNGTEAKNLLNCLR